MKYVVWILRLLIFVVVLLFALNNTHPVDVNFFADYGVTGLPLVVVLLITFLLGSVFAFFLMAPSYIRGKYKLAKLNDEIASLHRQNASTVRQQVQQQHDEQANGSASQPDIFISLQPQHNTKS